MENTRSVEFLLLQEVQFLEVKDDLLSQWEFVNVLDSEEAPEEEDEEDDADVDGGSVPQERTDDADDCNGDRRFDDVEYEIDGSQSGDGDAGGYGGDDHEDMDGYDGYDLDDELVPWSVNTKFGRQRMRKLGKRAFSKMNNSKRSPHMFVRPGCVRGKHGLGLKHSY